MKFRLCTLILLSLCLLALSTGRLMACSNDEGKTAVSQSSDEHCSTISDACVDTHPGQDCPPDTDGCGHCHCPGCGAVGGMVYAGFFKYTCLTLPVPDWSYDRQAACFCYNVPSTSAHLSTLFQPPRV